MTLQNINPINSLERALMQARKGELTLPKLIDILIDEKLFMPSVHQMNESGESFFPLIFDRDGVPMAAVFTEQSRMEIYREKIQDVILISFRSILTRLPENYGIVINPGYQEGLEILPHGVKNIIRDFL